MGLCTSRQTYVVEVQRPKKSVMQVLVGHVFGVELDARHCRRSVSRTPSLACTWIPFGLVASRLWPLYTLIDRNASYPINHHALPFIHKSWISQPCASVHLEPKPYRCLKESHRSLQEIVARPPSTRRHVSLVVRHRREDAEFRVEVFVYRHDGGDVAASIAVVGR